jgi:hypothetical protein
MSMFDRRTAAVISAGWMPRSQREKSSARIVIPAFAIRGRCDPAALFREARWELANDLLRVGPIMGRSGIARGRSKATDEGFRFSNS